MNTFGGWIPCGSWQPSLGVTFHPQWHCIQCCPHLPTPALAYLLPCWATCSSPCHCMALVPTMIPTGVSACLAGVPDTGSSHAPELSQLLWHLQSPSRASANTPCVCSSEPLFLSMVVLVLLIPASIFSLFISWIPQQDIVSSNRFHGQQNLTLRCPRTG